jgi:hypothetical protein
MIVVYLYNYTIHTKITQNPESLLDDMRNKQEYSIIDTYDVDNKTFADQVEHGIRLINRIISEYFNDFVNIAVVKDDNRPSDNIFVLAPIFSKESVFVRTERITVTDEFIDFVIGFFRDRSLNIVPLAGTDPVRFIIVK